MKVKKKQNEWRRGFIGIYALSMMEKGPVYGYQISTHIAEKTENAWRPGAGSVYPALKRLTENGFARERREGKRRVYTITPLGRKRLERLRKLIVGRYTERMEIMSLFLDLMPPEHVPDMLLKRLSITFRMIDDYSAQNRADAEYLIEMGITEAKRFIARIEKRLIA